MAIIFRVLRDVPHHPSVPVVHDDIVRNLVVSTASSGVVVHVLRWDKCTGCFNFSSEHRNVLTLYFLDGVPPTHLELVVECSVIPEVTRLCTWLQV
jgi:hypothetical protein